MGIDIPILASHALIGFFGIGGGACFASKNPYHEHHTLDHDYHNMVLDQ
jgi:hypothetical protein